MLKALSAVYKSSYRHLSICICGATNDTIALINKCMLYHISARNEVRHSRDLTVDKRTQVFQSHLLCCFFLGQSVRSIMIWFTKHFMFSGYVVSNRVLVYFGIKYRDNARLNRRYMVFKTERRSGGARTEQCVHI